MSDWHPGRGQKIERLYAWVATEADGGEGVCSMLVGGVHYPMVGADRERIESFRNHAGLVRRATGREVRLVCFTVREDLETMP